MDRTFFRCTVVCIVLMLFVNVPRLMAQEIDAGAENLVRMQKNLDVPSESPMTKGDVLEPEEPVVPRVPRQTGRRVAAERRQTKMIDDSLDFSEPTKRKEVKKLVRQGIEYLKTHPLQDAAHAFSYTKQFIVGDLYLFIVDNLGRVVADGEYTSLIWHNLYNTKDNFGNLFVQQMLQTARAGGGWVTYEWRGAVKQSYVEKVVKDGQEYIVGSGYYPHSKMDQVVSLVKGAANLAREFVKRGDEVEQAFSVMSYPGSRQFVRGDLYIYGLDETGVQVAHGERPGLIGTNSLDYQDAKGTYVNKEIFAALAKNPEGGVWIEYVSKGARKKAYAELVIGKNNKKYFVACGYYPDIEKEHAVDLVKKGYAFMKTNGKNASVKSFSDIRDPEFHKGDLYLTVYDMKGTCIADGKNSELIGRNLLEAKDEDGIAYVKEMLDVANKHGQGWVDAVLNNSFLSIYVEKIDLGLEQFIITCGIYPVSKADVISLLVKSAATTLATEDLEVATKLFVDPKGSFVRGDLSVFVLDDQGLCYAYGDQTNLIWKNLLSLKDDTGKEFVRLMIESAKNGPTHLSFKRGGKIYVAYVQRVEKNGVGYTIGSGFYK